MFESGSNAFPLGEVNFSNRHETTAHLEKLDPLDSLRIHQLLLLNATNDIRRQIEVGTWDGLDPKEWFFRIYGYHMGENRHQSPIYHAIATYEGANSFGMRGSLKSWFDEGRIQQNLVAKGHPDLEYQPQQGFEGRRWRANEMPMVRGVMMMGVPKDILPSLGETYFKAVARFIDQASQLPDAPPADYQKYAISLTLAFLMDFFHFKPDANGRTGEDFMVQLQRVLFKGQMGKVKTWSQHGLRARNIKSIVKPEYHSLIDSRQEIMNSWSVTARTIRTRLFLELSQHFFPGMKFAHHQLTDDFLIEHATEVETFFTALIQKIVTDPEKFLSEDLEKLGFDQFVDLLYRSTPPDQNGQMYHYQELDFYETHTGGQEVLITLQQHLQAIKVIEEEKLTKEKIIVQEIATWESAGQRVQALEEVLAAEVANFSSPKLYDLSHRIVTVLEKLLSLTSGSGHLWLGNLSSSTIPQLQDELYHVQLLPRSVEQHQQTLFSLLDQTFTVLIRYLEYIKRSNLTSDSSELHIVHRLFAELPMDIFQAVFTLPPQELQTQRQ